jgi:hypothetical protein
VTGDLPEPGPLTGIILQTMVVWHPLKSQFVHFQCPPPRRSSALRSPLRTLRFDSESLLFVSLAFTLNLFDEIIHMSCELLLTILMSVYFLTACFVHQSSTSDPSHAPFQTMSPSMCTSEAQKAVNTLRIFAKPVRPLGHVACMICSAGIGVVQAAWKWQVGQSSGLKM